MGLPSLLVMCALLGGGSFAAGSLPLSFSLSKTHLSRLSALGTGLLLGAALGIIIPEGIETVASAHSGSPPTSQIAVCLLAGFTFMLILEQVISPHSHEHKHTLPMHSRPSVSITSPTRMDFDAEIDALERELESDQQHRKPTGADSEDRGSLRRNSSMETLTFVPSSEEVALKSASRVVAFPLTLGLVMHALADGLALGVASLTTSSPGSAREGAPLSIVVFLALLVHKAPTALALTTSLLAASLPRQDCKKHLLVFSLSTPLGAMFTFAIFSVIGSGQQGQGLDALAGSALLVSGGTFLYVATVLQPVSHQEGNEALAESDNRLRVVFVVAGMFLPFAISTVLGHGHGH